jgi:hypothetical protein
MARLHVEIAVGFEPGMHLNAKRPHQPTLGVGEDAQVGESPADPACGRLHVLPVRQRQAKAGERLRNVFLHSAGELGVFASPFASQAATSLPLYIQQFVNYPGKVLSLIIVKSLTSRSTPNSLIIPQN